MIQCSKDRVNAFLLKYRGIILTDEEFEIVPKDLQVIASEEKIDRLVAGLLLLAWASKNGIGTGNGFKGHGGF